MNKRQRILAECAAHYYVLPTEIMSRARSRSIAHARQLAMLLIRETENCSLSDLGRFFDRDHTDISYAIKVVKHRIAGFAGPIEAERIERVRKAVGVNLAPGPNKVNG